jgi:DNA-binding NtrC family response regulator
MIAKADLSPELLASASRSRADRRYEEEGENGGSEVGRRGGRRSLKEATTHFERQLIEEALARAGYSLSRAARDLGLSRRGLHLKMSQLGIDRPAEFS